MKIQSCHCKENNTLFSYQQEIRYIKLKKIKIIMIVVLKQFKKKNDCRCTKKIVTNLKAMFEFILVVCDVIEKL